MSYLGFTNEFIARDGVHQRDLGHLVKINTKSGGILEFSMQTMASQASTAFS
mgnify:FL=1